MFNISGDEFRDAITPSNHYRLTPQENGQATPIEIPGTSYVLLVFGFNALLLSKWKNVLDDLSHPRPRYSLGPRRCKSPVLSWGGQYHGARETVCVIGGSSDARRIHFYEGNDTQRRWIDARMAWHHERGGVSLHCE